MARQARMPSVRKPSTTLPIVAVVAFIVLLAGGYGANWSWTGFNDARLWDWLQLLVFPVTVSILPLWLRTRHEWRTEWTILLVGILVAFVVVLIGGYGFNWTWTGFQGNMLWDWWKLLLVPFVLPVVLAWLTIHPEALDNTGNAQPTPVAASVAQPDAVEGR
jgi:hypothetical protein